MNNKIPAMQTDNVSHIQATSPQMVQIPATNVPMMLIQSPTALKRRFMARHILFKVAMGCLLLCAVMFIVGFSVPNWLNIMGLWTICQKGLCVDLPLDVPDWLNAVRAMECLALAAFLTGLAIELYQDFRKVIPLPAENKNVEVFAFLAGMFGLIGVTVFEVERPKGNLGIGSIFYRDIHIDWGFILVAVACSLSWVCAACITYSRVKHAAQTNAALASQIYVTQQPLTFQHPGVATGGATLAMYNQPPTAGYYYNATTAGNPYAQPYPVTAMAL